MPYAPWISPKSGNYLHSRQVRKRRREGRGRSKRVRRNYSRSAKLLPAAVRISLNEQFSIAPTLFNASVHLYFSLSLSLSSPFPCVCVFLSPFFLHFSPFSSSSSFSLSRAQILFLSPRFFFFFPLRRYFFLLVAHSFCASPYLLCERICVCPCARGIESPFTLLSISLPRFDGTFDALLYDWLLFFFWFFFFLVPFLTLDSSFFFFLFL